MSSNPNDLLQFILAQQQQQQEQQRQRGDAPLSTTQQLLPLYQQRGGAATALSTATQPPPSLDALSRLVANYLQGAAGGGTNAAAPASNDGMNYLPQTLAAQSIGRSHSMASLSNIDTPSSSGDTSVSGQRQELVKAAKLLAAINPGLAAAALEQALAKGARSRTEVQQQQSQYSDAQASYQTNAAASMSTNKLPIHTKGNFTTLTNSMRNNYEQKSITDSQASNGHNSTDKSNQGKPSTSVPTRPPAQLCDYSRVAASSTSSLSGSAGTKPNPSLVNASSSVALPVEPVSLLTLQTWSIEQLEAHVKKLQECNLPIPNTVRLVLDDAREKEEKKQAKRLANRKSASMSRARQKQLIDELTAAHAKLRRQALILANLPDPVIVIDTSGEIKFCSIQIERLLKYVPDEMLGSSIEDFILPDSRGALRQLIQDWAENKHRDFLAREEGWNQHEANNALNQGNDENNSNSSQDSSDEANNVSRSSGQSFPLLEVDFNDVDRVDSGKSLSNSSSSTSKKDTTTSKRKSQACVSSFTHHSSSLTADTSTSEDKDEPPAKKAKTCDESDNATLDASSSNERNLRETHAATIDDVMGSSVTRNNADAKLSSLMHYPKNHSKERYDTKTLSPTVTMQKPCLEDEHTKVVNTLSEKYEGSGSLSENSSTPTRGTGLNSSEDSGYKDSSEGSEDNEHDDSLLSGNSSTFKKNEKRLRPLAPACYVCCIRHDLTTIWCELTSSIRIGTTNNENSELGLTEKKSEHAINAEAGAANQEEKEILLCFRPILEGEKINEELRFPRQKIRAVNQEQNSSDQNVETSLN